MVNCRRVSCYSCKYIIIMIIIIDICYSTISTYNAQKRFIKNSQWINVYGPHGQINSFRNSDIYFTGPIKYVSIIIHLFQANVVPTFSASKTPLDGATMDTCCSALIGKVGPLLLNSVMRLANPFVGNVSVDPKTKLRIFIFKKNTYFIQNVKKKSIWEKVFIIFLPKFRIFT